MRHRNSSLATESDAAAAEAAKGALVGAAKWGFITAVLAVAGYALSPIYRGLTVQFKVFIQISGMTLGGMIEADRRVRSYELLMWREKRRKADQAVWRQREGLVEEEDRRGK